MLDADKVVNAPVLAVVLPMGPGEANRDVNPAPETVLEAASVVNEPVPPVTDVDADNVVNEPAAVVEPPITTLSNEPAVAGAMTTEPVPVGLMVTVAFAGDSVTVEDAVRVVNEPVPPVTDVFAVRVVKVPARGVVPPIAGGDAKSDVMPAPDTVLDAVNVVNDPAAAAVPPIAGGEAR